MLHFKGNFSAKGYYDKYKKYNYKCGEHVYYDKYERNNYKCGEQGFQEKIKHCSPSYQAQLSWNQSAVPSLSSSNLVCFPLVTKKEKEEKTAKKEVVKNLFDNRTLDEKIWKI